MKRTLLLALSIALAACGDDAGPGDEEVPSEGKKKDGAPEDAPVPRKDAGRDAAPDLLDAAMEAGPVDIPDASAPDAVVDAASFDAATVDAGSDAGTDASECVAAGDRCDDPSACCEGTSCVTSSEAAFDICAEVCTDDGDCESGCCTGLPGSGAEKVCAPQIHCDDDQPDPTAPLTGVNCFDDLQIYGSNDEYLGDATADSFKMNSVCSIGGPYGKTSSKGVFSLTSGAYSNSLAFVPEIRCSKNDFTPIAYVSQYKGDSKIRVIDPDDLCQVLDNSNL
jgi:hypothetical protein